MERYLKQRNEKNFKATLIIEGNNAFLKITDSLKRKKKLQITEDNCAMALLILNSHSKNTEDLYNKVDYKRFSKKQLITAITSGSISLLLIILALITQFAMVALIPLVISVLTFTTSVIDPNDKDELYNKLVIKPRLNKANQNFLTLKDFCNKNGWDLKEKLINLEQSLIDENTFTEGSKPNFNSEEQILFTETTKVLKESFEHPKVKTLVL